MTVTYAVRVEQLCNTLREIEHHSEEGDELFYCAYLLGLLGLYGNAEGEEHFDHFFRHVLLDALEAEKVTGEDRKNIIGLWETITG